MIERIQLTDDDIADDWVKVMHWDFPNVDTYDDFINMVGDDEDAIGMFVQLPAWAPAPQAIKDGVSAHYPDLTELFFVWPR